LVGGLCRQQLGKQGCSLRKNEKRRLILPPPPALLLLLQGKRAFVACFPGFMKRRKYFPFLSPAQVDKKGIKTGNKRRST
jgi:hypothetical protein